MAYANGTSVPSPSTTASFATWSIGPPTCASMCSLRKNMPSSDSPCGSPPIPKWPRNGSAVT